MKNYWSLMFDIENYVYIKEQHNGVEPTMRKLKSA